MARTSYGNSVFINCPFDHDYRGMFHAAVFTVMHCRFDPRCAQEAEDSSQTRVELIYSIVDECRFAIHDLSRTELAADTSLPRFNMPFELGLFLGAKYYGEDRHRNKNCLIFEKEPHSYDKYISDISGQDISAHEGNERILVTKIRNWLSSNSSRKLVGGNAIFGKLDEYRQWLPAKCSDESLEVDELTFDDYVNLVYEWREMEQ